MESNILSSNLDKSKVMFFGSIELTHRTGLR